MTNTDRYLVVSTDAHAGPSLRGDLRQYCPSSYLRDFDAYADEVESRPWNRRARARRDGNDEPTDRLSAQWLAAFDRVRACEGLHDPVARLHDMDVDGIAAEVIFAGGENGEELPFLGLGLSAGQRDRDAELRAVGGHIWNRWLGEYTAAEPNRLIGVMQIPVWDIPAAIREIEWGARAGLRVANLPAPRGDFPSYASQAYEPLWRACEANAFVLATHSGAGEPVLGAEESVGCLLMAAEGHFHSRRGLWQLIFGGVFERHPELKIVFTEQRATWVPETLRDLDSIHRAHKWLEVQTHETSYATATSTPILPRSPSEYWADHCFLSGSFLAPFEVRRRGELGLQNLMWGSDYPHTEGTWPRTRLAMRYALAGVPADECRVILGELALRVFVLDEAALRTVADRIGPTVAEIDEPIDIDQVPIEERFLAFRNLGAYA